MGRGIRRQAPALAIAVVALFAALAGGVYAATKIDGHTISLESIPGNRLQPGAVTAKQVKAESIPGNRLVDDSVTGAQVDAATLGEVPSATHANVADSAHDAETALNAVNATDAEKVNGHTAGCLGGTRAFAGGCWQLVRNLAALSAPEAAASCATQGGELPEALELAAFSHQQGIKLSPGGEWTRNIPAISGLDVYAVSTVNPAGEIGFSGSGETRNYRCVIPLIS